MKNILKTIKLLRKVRRQINGDICHVHGSDTFSIVRSSVLPKLISMNFNEIPMKWKPSLEVEVKLILKLYGRMKGLE